MGRKKVWKQPTEAQYKHIAECCIELLCKYQGTRTYTARIRILLPKGYKWPDDFPPGGQRRVYETPKGVENHYNVRAVLRWLTAKGYSTVTYDDIMKERWLFASRAMQAMRKLQGGLGEYIDNFDAQINACVDIEQELEDNVALVNIEEEFDERMENA